MKLFRMVLIFLKVICTLNFIKGFVSEENIGIIFTTESEIKITDLKLSSTRILLNLSETPYVLNYHYEKQLLFWTYMHRGIIKRASFSNLSPTTKIIYKQYGYSFVYDIAVDWINDRLYWTDYKRKTISVADIDGKNYKTLFYDIHEPDSLALNPFDGWMCWKSYRNSGVIEKAQMDGTGRRVLVVGDVLGPSGITIDFDSAKIYWIDVLNNAIFSVDYDGKNRQLVWRSTTMIRSSHFLEVFKDSLFWADTYLSVIVKANTTTGEISKLKTVVSDMRVLHPDKQPKELPCKKGQEKCTPSPTVPHDNTTDGSLNGTYNEDNNFKPNSVKITTISIIIVIVIVLALATAVVYYVKKKKKVCTNFSLF